MKRPAFNQTERVIIIWWSKNKPKSKFLQWWRKPITISRYEMAKQFKEIGVEFMKSKKIKKLISIIEYINIRLTHSKKNHERNNRTQY